MGLQLIFADTIHDDQAGMSHRQVGRAEGED